MPESQINWHTFTRNDFARLITSEGGPHLSLFIPPPIAVSNAIEEDIIRLGNLMRSAHATLAKYWMPEVEARVFLKPLEMLSRELLQVNPRKHSVAFFACHQACEAFRITQKLNEQLIIARMFAIRPLLPCLDAPAPYALLTISQHRVALYVSTSTGLERVTDFAAESFEKSEAELTVEPQTQVRAAAVGGSSRQGIVFHGQGSTRDAEKVDLENYLKHVDHALCDTLSQRSGIRLILAGVDWQTALYRANTHYKNIIEPTISGNVDHLSVAELQGRAEAIASDALCEQRQQKSVRIREHDVPIATDPEQVLIAAAEARIDSLFIDRDATLYGLFSADQGTLKEVFHAPSGDPGDSSHDLIELAAIQTLKNGGNVYSVPASHMPIAKRMVAGLRF